MGKKKKKKKREIETNAFLEICCCPEHIIGIISRANETHGDMEQARLEDLATPSEL